MHPAGSQQGGGPALQVLQAQLRGLGLPQPLMESQRPWGIEAKRSKVRGGSGRGEQAGAGWDWRESWRRWAGICGWMDAQQVQGHLGKAGISHVSGPQVQLLLLFPLSVSCVQTPVLLQHWLADTAFLYLPCVQLCNSWAFSFYSCFYALLWWLCWRNWISLAVKRSSWEVTLCHLFRGRHTLACLVVMYWFGLFCWKDFVWVSTVLEQPHYWAADRSCSLSSCGMCWLALSRCLHWDRSHGMSVLPSSCKFTGSGRNVEDHFHLANLLLAWAKFELQKLLNTLSK